MYYLYNNSSLTLNEINISLCCRLVVCVKWLLFGIVVVWLCEDWSVLVPLHGFPFWGFVVGGFVVFGLQFVGVLLALLTLLICTTPAPPWLFCFLLWRKPYRFFLISDCRQLCFLDCCLKPRKYQDWRYLSLHFLPGQSWLWWWLHHSNCWRGS